MSIYLKSAVQNLDCHITKLTEIRAELAGMLSLGPEIGKEVFAPAAAEASARPALPVQTLEPSSAKAAEGRPARGKRKQKRGGHPESSKAQVPSPKAARTVAGEGSGATGERMIQLGRGLKEPFGTAELMQAAGIELKAAGNTLTQWLLKDWIQRVGRGQYRRSKAFGGGSRLATGTPKGGEQMLAEIHKEIEAAKPKDE